MSGQFRSGHLEHPRVRQASSNHSAESSFSYERRIGHCRTLVIGAVVDEPHLPRPCIRKCE
jgi:hypothetical protein